ncbi:hypothetical protein NA57DRAFT_75814 [Rhizodiscina lignyota]|uniref:HD domain-containing protein n=1 Tax=Rhizodiscina lignyota TaxID=1504668 RepID=A0A9P4M663_9PEZI|nr:hypothetical protein NA57DRAFT_75814 [Rhizodiscina lignyota]
MCFPVEPTSPTALREPFFYNVDTKALIDKLPEDVRSNDICISALKFVAPNVHPSILNHSIRTFLHAYDIAEDEGSAFEDERLHLLFAACLLHDLGASPNYDGPQRFEVEGADVATDFLTSNGVSKEDAHEVWVAIACHSSAGIAEKISELSRLVRTAVLIDFGKKMDLSEEAEDEKEEIEEKWPRDNIEKILGDEVVKQAVKNPDKAPPASWPGILYRAHLAEPQWQGVNRAF